MTSPYDDVDSLRVFVIGVIIVVLLIAGRFLKE